MGIEFINEYDYRAIDKIKHKTYNEKKIIKNTRYKYNKHDCRDDNKHQSRNYIKKINKLNV